jgi:formate dehydrogenase beta subunit
MDPARSVAAAPGGVNSAEVPASVPASGVAPASGRHAVVDSAEPAVEPTSFPPVRADRRERHDPRLAIDPNQEFLVQPVDASWLQCNIECQEACPVGTNCRGYLNLAAEGRFEEGYILSREPNPVAAMCAYVCSAPCERACRRGDIDRPLAIRAMKRFLVEWHEASGIPDFMPLITPRPERVAVIGAGPSGLAVSRELATKGYQVTVFDSLPFAGGFALIGVPAFRLPREAIEMDVRLVERLGVTFHYNITIGKDVLFEDLQRNYDAIAICAGAMNAIGLDVPGADLDGVQYGVDFMKRANLGQPLEVGRNVVVIGGGYTAMDCSRTSLRHGAEHVSIVYRRTRSELVVDDEELGETEREGVRMEFLASPIEIVGEEGKVTGVRFIRNRLGEPDASGRRSPVPIEGSEFEIAAQTVIPAVSQATDLTFLWVESNFEVNRGRVKVDPATYATSVRGVFASGDFVTGPTTLIEAAGHGKKCAYAIDRYLTGRADVTVAANVKITSSWRHDMPEFYDVLPRQHIPVVQSQARMSSRDPAVNFTTGVELGYGATQAVAESTRCLMCNFNIWFDPFRCVLCGACADVCPEGVIHMVDVNQLKSEGPLPEIEEAYGWEGGAAMILDEERCIRCALCVKRCPFDAITMERFELQEISTDGRLYKESYRDAQLAGTPGVAGGAR